MPEEMPHAFVNPPCPWLPAVDQAHDCTLTRRHGPMRGVDFHHDALRFAQSQWRCGKPAQAILQLDKAWGADLPGGPEDAAADASPYMALAWIMQTAAAGNHGYLGNPVRHFQHLASRMSGPRAEIRAWRAWFCMHLAERLLPSGGFPRDGRQLAREGLFVPAIGSALAHLARMGWPGEARQATAALDDPPSTKA